MRLIDAGRIEKRLLEEEPHDGWDEYYEGFNRMKGIALNAIDATPTIDAVPVVRCGDCMYYQDNNGGYPHPDCRWGHDETPDADDYCSFGEKMDGGTQ